MANVNLPARFKNTLETDQQLDGIVKSTVSEFGEILEQNKLYFFSEYTDHGIKHIQDVLLSSENLITDETYNILGYKDIGYYILSVILHDVGMHIDLQGFICLLNGEFDDVRIENLDSETWKNLWDHYLSEARKFSGRQLKYIFGDEDTIVRVPPFQKPGEINENDKKLIGEFIRRHHPRLAHEIALKGFPGKPNYLEFASSLDSRSKNIIGLIARSHGTDLRMCLDTIESIYGRESRRFPNGIHATFLMVLLRIADYIQIDSSRTSTATIKNKTFSSPVSAKEHDAHLAIETVDYIWHDDPERIFVTAQPKDSQMFVKLKKLFKNIQHEFDISWAVLGELYGKSAEHKPKIKYRRINSNLENKSFSNQQEYVADSFSFKTNEEIIKLMVAPLYGDEIKYGVRELLQNALDACKEREFIENELNQHYEPKINVNIINDSDEAYLIISDNGIGMNSDIIKNYFLSAGASYRQSLEWQSEFINSEGETLIRRSGRFGVGILSAFLIGNEIMVETKRKDSAEGYAFKAGLNTNQINVLKKSDLRDGTIIKIKIDQSKIEAFKKINLNKWHKWYCLSSPEVQYLLFGQQLKPYSHLDPDNNIQLPIDWNAIDSKGYNKILWTYSDKYSDTRFTCNGINIPETYNVHFRLISKTPKISVFDNNGVLPLTLNRNTTTTGISFLNDLEEDIYKDFLAYLLTKEVDSYVDKDHIVAKSSQIKYPGFNYDYISSLQSSYGINCYDPIWGSTSNFIDRILISKKGFILNYNYFLNKTGSIDVILLQLNKFIDLQLDIFDCFVLISDHKASSIEDYKTIIEARNFNTEKQLWEPFNSRIFLKSERYKFIFKSNKKRISNWLNQLCKESFEFEDLTCLELNEPKKSLINDDFLKRYHRDVHLIREYPIDCLFDGNEILNKILTKYIGDDIIIPYSLEERRKKYPLAFKELSRYMEKYIKS